VTLRGNDQPPLAVWELALPVFEEPDHVPIEPTLGEKLMQMTAVGSQTGHSRVLIEFACSETSALGEVGVTRGWHVERLHRQRCDLSRSTGLSLAMKLARQHPGCHLFASLPCTA